MKNPEKVHQILASVEFKNMVSLRWSVSLSLTLLMLIVYLGFIFTVAFAKDFLASKIGVHINLGLVIGFGIILFTWLLTGIYVYWANNKYDKTIQELKNKL
jgi:uncharacterized membrane protein (DUF485 family)